MNPNLCLCCQQPLETVYERSGASYVKRCRSCAVPLETPTPPPTLDLAAIKQRNKGRKILTEYWFATFLDPQELDAALLVDRARKDVDALLNYIEERTR